MPDARGRAAPHEEFAHLRRRHPDELAPRRAAPVGGHLGHFVCDLPPDGDDVPVYLEDELARRRAMLTGLAGDGQP